MKPRDLAGALKKRGWLIILIVLLAALISTLIARVKSPTYKVEITVSAIAPRNPSTKQADPTIAGSYVLIMPSITTAMESLEVAEAARERLLANGIDIPVEELLKKVKAEPEVQTSFARLTFTDGSPTRVADIANIWGEVLEQKSSDDLTVSSPNLKELLLGGKLVVTTTAIPPRSPSQPKPYVYLGLGVFVGLVLGFGLVIGIDYFDPHFRSVPEVEETLGIPVLGTIPKLRGTGATTLLTSRGEASLTHDAYSQLRTTLMFSLAEGAFNSTLIAAAIPTEDSPYIPVNLAASMAHAGRKTLLIDCDLREKAVSRLLEALGRPGLADILARGGPVREKIIATPTPSLFFLPAGHAPEEPSDLLSLPLMDQVLRELEGEYEKLILSAPPLLTAIDGVIAASKANLSLVVVDAQKCSRNLALSALEGFHLLHITPTGVVLSNARLSRRERAMYARRTAPEPRAKRKEAAAAAPLPKPKARAVEGAVSTPPRTVAAASVQPARAAKPPAARPARFARTKEKKAALEVDETGIVAGAAPAAAAPPAAAPPTDEAETAARAAAAARSTGEELLQMQGIVTDDFRRMGATGAPIPKQWLRALNSDKPDVRESARMAISAYYHSFLGRYSISEESVERITESIIRMMRREGEFATMSEEEAQQHLQKMLVDAGARFSTGSSGGRSSGSGEQAPASTAGEGRGEGAALEAGAQAGSGGEPGTAGTARRLEAQPQREEKEDRDED